MSRVNDLLTASRIDRFCDDFEQRLRSGQHPKIQSYLSETPESERGLLLAELRAILAERNSSARTHDSISWHTRNRHNSGEVLPNFGARYQLRHKVGAGAFGTVYLAQDLHIGRSVAIKVANGTNLEQSKRVFSHEVHAAAQLDHPNIIPVYDVGATDQGKPYVIAKYISGGSLADRIRSSSFGIVQAVAIVAVVAHAIRHAHSMGIIHRDIKPANILLDESGKPYITDFGMALDEREYGRGGNCSSGSVAYMSPEQASGDAHLADRRTDVFSVGAVLYELLTGVRPFGNSPIDELLKRIVSEPAVSLRALNPGIPESLEAICLKCLKKDPSDRFASMDELAQDLATVIAETRDKGLAIGHLDRSKSAFIGLRDYIDAELVPLYFDELHAYDRIAASQTDECFRTLMDGEFVSRTDRLAATIADEYFACNKEDTHDVSRTSRRLASDAIIEGSYPKPTQRVANNKLGVCFLVLPFGSLLRK